VLYLHRLREVLEGRLAREGRTALASACFDFLPARAALDLAGWPETDIFAMPEGTGPRADPAKAVCNRARVIATEIEGLRRLEATLDGGFAEAVGAPARSKRAGDRFGHG